MKQSTTEKESSALLPDLFSLILPITLQSLISTAVNAADVMMTGCISQTALSAVSTAGQITFILQLFFMGLSGGLSILSAQYWGRKDTRTAEKILSIVLFLSGTVSLIFFLMSELMPQVLLGIFSNDPVLIALGARYLRALAPSYLLMGISQCCLVLMRTIDKASHSALISTVSLIINIVCNAAVIFLLFPGQEKPAVTGLAVCTVIARLAELLWALTVIKKSPVSIRWNSLFSLDKLLFRDYIRCTAPMQLNYIIWGCGLSATAAIIGHISSDLVAANAVVSTVRNLAVVVCNGIAGSSILIGQQLGRNDIPVAQKTGRCLCICSLVFGALAGLAILAARPLIFSAFSLEETALEYAQSMLWICAFYCIGKSFNSTLVGGIFCAGGDTRFGLFCDTLVMWGIIVPLGCICAFLLQLPPVHVYLILCLDEFLKMPAVYLRYRQKKWLNNLTRQEI